MRIGILTLPLETNYGGNLQAFALQTVLRRMGHDVVTIDRHNRRRYPSLKSNILGFLNRNYKYYVKGELVSTQWNPFISNQDYNIISSETQKFINRNIKLTKSIWSDELDKIEEEYKFDVYIVGSDQVWLSKYCPASFLDFVTRDNVIKLFYAASCGKDSFFSNQDKLNVCKKLSKDFKGISVREEKLVSLCQRHLNVEAKYVLDPTMLLTPQDYLSATINMVPSNPIIFSYILDNSKEKDHIISYVQHKLSLDVINVNVEESYVKGKNTDITKCIYPSIDDWLNNLNRSKFVITDSFHGTVFAILFNKPFITIGNPKRGVERFNSLLNKFGLERRLITLENIRNLDELIIENDNFLIINSQIERFRKISIDFLIESLQ